MTNLGPTAIRIRNADAQDSSGNAALRIYPDLLREHGETVGCAMWIQALNEILEADRAERESDSDEKRPFTMDDYREQF